jgi:hypothetical protein
VHGEESSAERSKKRVGKITRAQQGAPERVGGWRLLDEGQGAHLSVKVTEGPPTLRLTSPLSPCTRVKGVRAKTWATAVHAA